MHGKALKYLLVECVGSGIVNGILNLGAAYLLFHGRGPIPTGGSKGLIQDLIGETFLVTFLSYLVAALLARQRRRVGTLPATDGQRPPRAVNIYLWSFGVGLLFTLVLVPSNAWLLPRVFPDGLSFRQVLLFKTLFGAVFGSIATGLAISRALSEAHISPEASKH